MAAYDIANKSGKCFICGTSTQIMVKNSDIYFCNSNSCIRKVQETAERYLKGNDG